jgi:hypothetical protein
MLNKGVGIILGLVLVVIGYMLVYGPKGDYLFSPGLVLMGVGMYLVIKSLLGGVRLR